MRAAALAAGLFVLAGCGGEAPETNNAALARTIENIAEERPAAKAGPPPLALAPLGRGDLERELRPGAGCDFSVGDRILFVAVAGDALAKPYARTVHFTSAAPVGPTGGFFLGGQYSISVGRLTLAGASADETTSWPAALTVTDRNRDEGGELRLNGAWRCRA